MSRGGRGGGRGGRGGMRGNPLPFEVDEELTNNADSSVADASDENKAKHLFPPIDLIAPGPITPEERQQVAINRELRAKRQASIYWTGTKEQILAYDGAKGKGRTALDAFDSMETYSKKKRAKPDSFVPPEKRKFPKMSGDHIPTSLMPDTGPTGSKKRSGNKKSVTDRLANLDENKDDEGGEGDDESDDGAAKNADDDDAASEPQDSEFSEDEADDADNDYNAENYFSGGEGDDGSVGGEDAGEEGY